MSIRYYALKLGLYFVYSGNIVVPSARRESTPKSSRNSILFVAIYNLFPHEQTLLHYEIRFANPEIKPGAFGKCDTKKIPRIAWIPELHLESQRF